MKKAAPFSVLCRYFLLLASALLTGSALLSCASDGKPELDPSYTPGPNDKLTRSELITLINAGQEFAVHSESVKKRLTPEQCRYVRNTQPSVREVYYAPKYGLLEMRWKISKHSVLILRSRGYLNRDKQNWELEICTVQETAPVPEGLLSPELEKSLALPPK
ncbi:MAG: hypothetical protein J5944_08265 [Lentisphaeria bacterium]|nr:hypothetical protein [Lentisphaeria bacterium]